MWLLEKQTNCTNSGLPDDAACLPGFVLWVNWAAAPQTWASSLCAGSHPAQQFNVCVLPLNCMPPSCCIIILEHKQSCNVWVNVHTWQGYVDEEVRPLRLSQPKQQFPDTVLVDWDGVCFWWGIPYLCPSCTVLCQQLIELMAALVAKAKQVFDVTDTLMWVTTLLSINIHYQLRKNA
jgi:hypothetical protein